MVRGICVGWLCATVLVGGGPAVAPAESGRDLDTVERRLIAEINAYRARHGLPGLRPAQSLLRAADEHSRAMVADGFFGHSAPGGESWSERLREHVPSGEIGEVLGELPPRAEHPAARLVRMWARSNQHRAVLLAPDLERIGVARRTGEIDGRRRTVFTTDLSG